MGDTARADTSKDALHQRLDSLSDDERKLLAPLMERGPVALIEFSEADTLPAVVVAGYVEADAARVADVIQHPERYPSFMHTLDSVEVRSRVGTQTSYKWTWRTGMLFLEGENRMTALAPPPDRPEQGYRIAVHSERGHLGEGRLMWRVFPAGPKRSMLVLSMRVDMRDANFVMRQLDTASRSINRSVNLSLCYVMMLGTKREAERLAGTPEKLAESVPFAAPAIDVQRFTKLLKRADIVLLELTQRGLGKVSIVGRTGLTRAMLDPVMKNPELFGKSLVPGSYARVTKQEGPVKTFEWGISLPLIGTSGVMTLAEKSDSEVWVDAVDGSLKGGKWRFQTPELAGGEAVLLGYSLFDITQTSWLIQKIAELDPVMGHGLAAASQVMVLRALRSRARSEAKTRAKEEKARAEKAKSSESASGR
jgi:hypothetical protein